MTKANDLRRKALIGKSALGRVAAAIQYADEITKASEPFREIVQRDVGSPKIQAFGRQWDVEDFIGEIKPKDVGKRIYLRGDILQVENDDQRNAREGRKAARPEFRKAAFKAGDKVFHEKYGLGTVTDKRSGANGEFVGVAFDAGDTVFVMPSRLELRESSGAGKTRTVGGDSTKPQGYIVGRKAARPAMRKGDAPHTESLNWEPARAVPNGEGYSASGEQEDVGNFQADVRLLSDGTWSAMFFCQIWTEAERTYDHKTAQAAADDAERMFNEAVASQEDESNARTIARNTAGERRDYPTKGARPEMRKGNDVVCPNCGSDTLQCPECGRNYSHGEASHCENPDCQEMNAPLDCEKCGLVASDDLQGVIDFEGDLIRYGSRKAVRPAMRKDAAQDETIARNQFIEGSRYYVGKDGNVWYAPGGKTASNTGKSVDEFVADVKAGKVKAKLTGKFA